MRARDRYLKPFLRITGTVALLAVVAVVMPYSWMNAVHQWLGMGPLPAQPIVGYLARSTSAFYAILGGLLWLVSFDLRRYRPVLHYLGLVMILLGITIGIVDFMEGMPIWWRLAEGPINVVVGVLILLFTL
jgi:NADH:ubiquinone oxidoreductase subunit 6 (subunit J)